MASKAAHGNQPNAARYLLIRLLRRQREPKCQDPLFRDFLVCFRQRLLDVRMSGAVAVAHVYGEIERDGRCYVYSRDAEDFVQILQRFGMLDQEYDGDIFVGDVRILEHVHAPLKLRLKRPPASLAEGRIFDRTHGLFCFLAVANHGKYNTFAPASRACLTIVGSFHATLTKGVALVPLNADIMLKQV